MHNHIHEFTQQKSGIKTCLCGRFQHKEGGEVIVEIPVKKEHKCGYLCGLTKTYYPQEYRIAHGLEPLKALEKQEREICIGCGLPRVLGQRRPYKGKCKACRRKQREAESIASSFQTS